MFWIKSLHLGFAASWFAGLFCLPRNMTFIAITTVLPAFCLVVLK